MKQNTRKHIISISLKASLVFIFLLNASLAKAQDCTYTLSMQDSYGDGWNGAYLEVFINDALVGTYAAIDEGSTEQFEAEEGDWLDG